MAETPKTLDIEVIGVDRLVEKVKAKLNREPIARALYITALDSKYSDEYKESRWRIVLDTEALLETWLERADRFLAVL